MGELIKCEECEFFGKTEGCTKLKNKLNNCCPRWIVNPNAGGETDICTMLSPISDRVIVRENKAPEKKGSIYLPEQARAAELPQIGEVVAVGPGKMRDNDTRDEMPVKVGDRVLYGRHAGTPIKVVGEDMQCMHVTEIYAVIKQEQTI